MLDLIRIEFFSAKRSSLFGEKIVSKILVLIGFSFSFLYLLGLGFFLDIFFVKINPNSSPIDTFSRYFLFFFIVDIVLKFFFKPSKTTDIFPYLTLPIKRNKLFLISFWKEMFSFWNFLWVILVTPLCFKVFFPDNGWLCTLLLIFSFYVVSLTISIVIRHIKIAFERIFIVILIPVALVVGFSYLACYVSQTENLLIDFNRLFSKYAIWMFIGMILLVLVVLFLFLGFSKRELYVNLNGGNYTNHFMLNFSLLGRVGDNGELLKFCFKEIFRTPLKNNVIIMMWFVLCLSLSQVENKVGFYGSSPFFIRLMMAFVPVMFIGSIFGEMTFSAESTFFDGLMSIPKRLPFKILKMKYIICVFIDLLFTILLFCFFYSDSFLFWISTFFFGVGIFLFWIFQIVVYNRKRLDINLKIKPFKAVGSFSVYSLLTIIAFTICVAIIAFIAWLFSNEIACYVMLITGIVFIVTSSLWLQNIYNRFLKRRYENMNCFRGN